MPLADVSTSSMSLPASSTSLPFPTISSNLPPFSASAALPENSSGLPDISAPGGASTQVTAISLEPPKSEESQGSFPTHHYSAMEIVSEPAFSGFIKAIPWFVDIYSTSDSNREMDTVYEYANKNWGHGVSPKETDCADDVATSNRGIFVAISADERLQKFSLEELRCGYLSKEWIENQLANKCTEITVNDCGNDDTFVEGEQQSSDENDFLDETVSRIGASTRAEWLPTAISTPTEKSKLVSISAMKEFSKVCVEEIRWYDSQVDIRDGFGVHCALGKGIFYTPVALQWRGRSEGGTGGPSNTATSATNVIEQDNTVEPLSRVSLCSLSEMTNRFLKAKSGIFSRMGFREPTNGSEDEPDNRVPGNPDVEESAERVLSASSWHNVTFLNL